VIIAAIFLKVVAQVIFNSAKVVDIITTYMIIVIYVVIKVKMALREKNQAFSLSSCPAPYK
jgi:hypothetical protein